MKATLKWLKEYVDFDFSPEELANAFTMTGTEVESISYFAKGIEKIIAGKILSLEKLQGEGNLFLCQVDIGREILKIVTAAPNIKEGMVVPVVPKGTMLPTGITVTAQTFRGIESSGVLCSEQDLGLVDHSEGVIKLPKNQAIGKPVPELVEAEDVVFELSPTPNRPDCLSVFGLAREISAITGNPLHLPEIKLKESGLDTAKLVSIEIKEPDLCPRYTARIIQGVRVGESPSFMKRRLKAVGVRSINNVVDITNYLLMEFGHPLHAFDFDFIRGKKIVVRCAGSGEKFKTLDGVERALKKDTLLIADSEKGIAIAGIMGGENSEVSESTKNVLLESAYFDPVNIRRGSKYLGLSTEASYRFERGADPDILKYTSERAIALMQEMCGGEVTKGIVDEYPKKISRKTVLLRSDRIEKILGVKVSPGKVRDILEKLGIAISKEQGGNMKITVPSYRPDLEREIDIIEEVARIFDYSNIPVTYPPVKLSSVTEFGETPVADQIKNIMTGWGFFEVINYSFIDDRIFDRFLIGEGSPLRRAVKIKNPLSEEQNILRTTLIPELVENLALNIKRFVSDLKIFEIGKVFFSTAPNELPREKTYFSGLATGEWEQKSWMNVKRQTDFYDVKGIIESVSNFFLIPVTFQMSEKEDEEHGLPGFLDKRKSANICQNEKCIGFLGELHPDIREKFEFRQPVVVFEIILDDLASDIKDKPVYKLIPKNPPSYRDIAIILPESVTYEETVKIIKEVGGELLEEVSIFDLYRGGQIPQGKKSMAFSLIFRDPKRTLTDEEVDRVRLDIISELNKRLEAELRS
ncbi:MAG: phenylalanine--tRNA ligase subunit beta [Candidatus Schekmanbacteria bacterium GWA2_38_11]|uniref:Phenylalanine--tRNA ligase beta subunit n=1 Tax=Candidatus Schekmanbacteria bacterium GWA2_38_11 TaxID=1817876 RepID=A0A1F7RBU6_9BACT|nr:MAG: phenylalanine--tRNA ligase subunit beta [Candidatus Schekmanbacteria bacterium GWA2_38_11]